LSRPHQGLSNSIPKARNAIFIKCSVFYSIVCIQMIIMGLYFYKLGIACAFFVLFFNSAKDGQPACSSPG